jgi:predicted RNase H-like nuclease (RuvC/YqgF family)
MADMRELKESMIVGEGVENEERASERGGPNDNETAVTSVESRVAALEQRVESFARELAQLTRMTEQLALLSGKIASLEQSAAAHSRDGADRDGAGIAEQVRQLDERMQKLAVMLAQQNWNRA